MVLRLLRRRLALHPETRDGVDGTHAAWKYTFTTRPTWLSPVADRIGTWLLGREIRARLAAFARACADPQIVSAATDTPAP